MATDLMLPDGLAPSNLHLRPSAKHRHVSSDMFDIAKRLRQEVDPRLHVFETEDGASHKWYIMERVADGSYMFVMKEDVLDARIIEDCRRMLSIPFNVRLTAMLQANKTWEEQQHREQIERMYEQFGYKMWMQLEHDGFVETRGVSYAKRGVNPTR